jgi:ubiquinone/menaquinone biosynthesis C-methylase UbiE
MSEIGSMDFISSERERIRVEYDRRAREMDPHRYAAWQPAEVFTITNRNRAAVHLLQQADVFPSRVAECLEVGCGIGAWFEELEKWGVSGQRLHGIDLNTARAAYARERFPSADIRIGDAVELPWPDATFQFVVASTLFTSVLESRVRRLIADEIQRVLAPNGALLWYDFAYDNPRNAHVRGIKRNEIRQLFPVLSGHIRSVTLFPPLARLLTPKFPRLAQFLERIPLLRSHLIAVLVKRGGAA